MTGPDADVRSAHLLDDEEFTDWDGEGGRCFVLRFDAPLDEDEIRMCLTGLHIEYGATAYVRSQGVEWSLRLSKNASGGLETSSGTGWFAFDGARCGPPTHDVPDDRWVMMSHCDDGAALATMLPTMPDGSSHHVVVAMDGSAHDTVVVDTLRVEDWDGGPADELLALNVGPVRGAPVSCLIVVPASAPRWFESCVGFDEQQHGRVFLHRGLLYAVDVDAGESRLTPLALGSVVMGSGCTESVVSTLVAIEDFDPGGMLSGIACEAATDALRASERDDVVTATQAGIFAKPGPLDGRMLRLERSPVGNLHVVDAGTGIDPEPWPLPIPPWRVNPLVDGQLPTIDVTEQVLAAIPGEGPLDELRLAVSKHLAELHPTEGGPVHTVELVPTLPLIVAPNVTYLDDSVTSGAYYVWFREVDDGMFAVDRAFVVNRCGRGITEVDGVPLCV